ncbi:hypothetical protein Tco_1422468 [Tanacetum coccineum]
MDQAGGSYIKNVGIAILDVLLDLANKEMNIFKNFMGVDVPTNQPRSSASTQGKNITVIATRTRIKYDDEAFDDIENFTTFDEDGNIKEGEIDRDKGGISNTRLDHSE